MISPIITAAAWTRDTDQFESESRTESNQIGILLRDLLSDSDRKPSRRRDGVDATRRQRTVQALSCHLQICSQYSQTITAWTRDTERYWPSRSRQICGQCSQTITACPPSPDSGSTRDTERCANQNPELNQNESDPDFLEATIAGPSMTAAVRRSRRPIRSGPSI